MQSLLTSIHCSLAQSRSAFALRVFVSYDALGRRKESVLVDIEQPRPPPSHSPPRHTIRTVTPLTPLHPASLPPSPSLAPASHPAPVTTPSRPRTPLSHLAHTAAALTRTPAAAALNPSTSAACPRAVNTAPAPSQPTSRSAASAQPPFIRPQPSSLPLFDFIGQQSCATLPPSSSTATKPAPLALAPRGATDAADVEMGQGSGGTSPGPRSGPGSDPTRDSESDLLESNADRARAAVDQAIRQLEQSIGSAGKRKKKRKLWKRQRQAQWGPPESAASDVEVDEKMEMKYNDDTDDEPDMREDGTSALVPTRLVSGDPTLTAEYMRQLAEVMDCGGYLSAGSYRKLMALIDEDVWLLGEDGREWESRMRHVEDMAVWVVPTDADVPYQDDARDLDAADHKTRE